MGMRVPSDKDKAGRRSKRYDGTCEQPGSAKSSPNKKNSNGSNSSANTPGSTPTSTDDDKGNSFSKELARLQFFGAGPKMAGMPSEKTTKDKTRGVKLNFEYDPVRKLLDRRWNTKSYVLP